MVERSSPHNSDGEADDISAEWLAEFEAASKRSLPERFRDSFIRTLKPVPDACP